MIVERYRCPVLVDHGIRQVTLAEATHNENGLRYRVQAFTPPDWSKADTMRTVAVLSPFRSAAELEATPFVCEGLILEQLCAGHPYATEHAPVLARMVAMLLDESSLQPAVS